MNPNRRYRLLAVSFMVLGVCVAVALTLYALRQNINLYYTPSQIATGEAPQNRVFRLGGLVKKGSVERQRKDLKVAFTLTDMKNTIIVEFDGILPDLFREGQGIVAQGKLNRNKHFIASQVLAKHDEKYMPPAVKAALDRAKT